MIVVRTAAMCRWIAYRGEPTALERYVTSPAHSLVEQSMRALESTAATNGDGFGLGWYGELPEPGHLSRSASGVVGRQSAQSLPPYPLASVLRPCPRRHRHRRHAAELPSVRVRALDVHAQWRDRRLVADPPHGRGDDPGRTLSGAPRHHRFRSGVSGHHGRRRRAGSGRRDRAYARHAHRTGQCRRPQSIRCGSLRR